MIFCVVFSLVSNPGSGSGFACVLVGSFCLRLGVVFLPQIWFNFFFFFVLLRSDLYLLSESATLVDLVKLRGF